MKILICVGTRPEAIKLAPVILALSARSGVEPLVVLTGQHRELTRQILTYWGIVPHHDLALMREGQTPLSFTLRCAEAVESLQRSARADFIVAQGDTSTVLAAALAAFLGGTRFAHVEAGLRTGDLRAPWPEEFNRRVATLAAELHFAPTADAAANLVAEGVPPARVLVTGNTGIDALRTCLAREAGRAEQHRQRLNIAVGEKIVLVTAHRRESFGGPLDDVFGAVSDLAERFPSVRFIVPVHPNPAVRTAAARSLKARANLVCLEPLDYPELVWLMSVSQLVLTDSGGIQEEGPAIGQRVLVLRDCTERPEGLATGLVELVGTKRHAIITRVSALLGMPSQPLQPSDVYGDGLASERIVDAILNSRTQAVLDKG